MKLLLCLAIVAIVSFQTSDAYMSAFACSDSCFSYLKGPYCISNGSVVCDNCARDNMLCENPSLTSSDCTSDCDK